MKKALIVGAGASGIFSALLLAEKHADWEITIVEKEQKIGKKLRATGNGHCNLLNEKLDPSYYNPRSKLARELLKEHDLVECKAVLERWGVPLLQIGDLDYPLSYHAPSFVNHLVSLLQEKGVKIEQQTRFIDYQINNRFIDVSTDKFNRPYDIVIFASGGCSTPKLGSDGALFEIFAKHGYKIQKLSPGLTPIVVKEPIAKSLVGLRHKATVTLYDDKGAPVYSEKGEYLYKKNGLSGICIFNIASKIKWLEIKKPLIRIDLFDGINTQGFFKTYLPNEAILESPLYEEIVRQSLRTGIQPGEIAHCLTYHPAASYSFEDSQVTIGGIDENCLSNSLGSSIEKNVYFVGEAIDVDGLCGGFNLSWSLLSAIHLIKGL